MEIAEYLLTILLLPSLAYSLQPLAQVTAVLEIDVYWLVLVPVYLITIAFILLLHHKVDPAKFEDSKSRGSFPKQRSEIERRLGAKKENSFSEVTPRRNMGRKPYRKRVRHKTSHTATYNWGKPKMMPFSLSIPKHF